MKAEYYLKGISENIILNHYCKSIIVIMITIKMARFGTRPDTDVGAGDWKLTEACSQSVTFCTTYSEVCAYMQSPSFLMLPSKGTVAFLMMK